MRRTVLAPLAAAFALFASAVAAPAAAQSDQQTLVDRATLTVQETINGSTEGSDVRSLMRKSRAVLVCPRIFKAGFIIGGSGGGCVLTARDARGSWSYPAFFGMGSGSVGFQIGIQDSAVVLMILTDKGLRAILDSQFKFGGDIGIAVATLGAGVEGGFTTDLQADIVAFSQNRGLFAGLSLQGSVLNQRSDWNRSYYGREMSPQQIVLDMSGRNQGADPLREVLTRVGAGGAVRTAAAPAPVSSDTVQAAPRGSVQRQNLAPPPR